MIHVDALRSLLGDAGHAVVSGISLSAEAGNATDIPLISLGGDGGSSSSSAGTEVGDPGQHINAVGYCMIAFFLAVCSIIMFILFYHISRRNFIRRSDGSFYPTRRATKHRVQRRYETVEHWIISKEAQPHDDFCDKVVNNFCHHNVVHSDNDLKSQRDEEEALECPSSPSSGGEGDDITDAAEPLSDSSSHAMADSERSMLCGSVCQDDCEEIRECPICMSELKAGQIVSWSANENCGHVYHHECIKQWLLRHIECCLCKSIFLPVDEKRGKAKQSALKTLSHRYAASCATSYFCTETGLVRIPRSVRCTRQELEQLERRIFDGAIPPAALAAFRGSRQDVTQASNDPDTIIEANRNELNTSSSTDETEQEYDPTNSASFDSADYISGDDTVHAQMAPPTAACSGLPTGSTQQSDLMKDIELGTTGCNTTSGTTSGDDELVSASDYLEQNKSKFGDNRCCITEDDHGVEVRSMTSPVEESAPTNTV